MGLAHQSQRSLSSVKLTRRFHFRLMGLWVVWSLSLVVALNLVIYLYVGERWGGSFLEVWQYEEYQSALSGYTVFALLNLALFSSAIIGLAILTAHRMAAPLMRVEAAVKEILGGNLDYRLHLRDYDHLDELEAAFNQMVAGIRSGGISEQISKEDGGTQRAAG